MMIGTLDPSSYIKRAATPTTQGGSSHGGHNNDSTAKHNASYNSNTTGSGLNLGLAPADRRNFKNRLSPLNFAPPQQYAPFDDNATSATSGRLTSPTPRSYDSQQHIKPFTNQTDYSKLKGYIVRFKQGTGTDDIKEIEKVLNSQGGKYARRGSLSHDLDAKLPVESLRYLSEQPCVERLVKSHGREPSQ